jgi:hypothetical protein
MIYDLSFYRSYLLLVLLRMTRDVCLKLNEVRKEYTVVFFYRSSIKSVTDGAVITKRS